MVTRSRFLVGAILVAFLSGCSSTGYDKAAGTSASLQKAAQDIDTGAARIDAVLAALTDLVNNPAADLKPQFKTFVSAMEQIESLPAIVRDRAAEAQQRGAEYSRKWDEELAKMQNEEIRARSAQRRNAVNIRFEQARASYEQARAAFGPFLSDLRDIRTALSADLTLDGLAAIRQVVAKASKDAEPLRTALAKLSEDFRDLGASLSTATSRPAATSAANK